MKLLDRPIEVKPSIARSGDDPAHLAAIYDHEVALTLWSRPNPVTVPREDLDGLVGFNVTCSIGEVRHTINIALSGATARSWHVPLLADIVDLSHRFAALMEIDDVSIRLEAISGNACWKFHSDYVRARLLTTYVGPGTEWALQGENGLDDVHRIPTGHVGIFKGREWTPDGLLLHRSPPIAGTGDVRLLLVIDRFKV